MGLNGSVRNPERPTANFKKSSYFWQVPFVPSMNHTNLPNSTHVLSTTSDHFYTCGITAWYECVTRMLCQCSTDSETTNPTCIKLALIQNLSVLKLILSWGAKWEVLWSRAVGPYNGIKPRNRNVVKKHTFPLAFLFFNVVYIDGSSIHQPKAWELDNFSAQKHILQPYWTPRASSFTWSSQLPTDLLCH